MSYGIKYSVEEMFEDYERTELDWIITRTIDKKLLRKLSRCDDEAFEFSEGLS